MMPDYRDTWTVAKTGYMLHSPEEGQDMRGESE